MVVEIVTYKEASRGSGYACIASKVALLFTIYIITAGFLILRFRQWDPDIAKQILGILVYPALLFGTAAMAIQRWGKNVWALPLALLLFMLLPFCVALAGAWVLFPLGLLGLCLTVWSCCLNREFYAVYDEASGVVHSNGVWRI